MDAAELVYAGAARQAELVAAGEVSPRELVDACLERIERIDPKLNAFRVVRAERARAEADALDGGAEGRPLYGVPVAVKDDADVAGEVTAYGTPLLRAPAGRDAEVVRRLREAGAIVIGKTNVPELTQWPFAETAGWGITRNPWDLSRTPGGSSGGSAAAIAAGLVGLATGSDGQGSIRIPAACCGIFGLKPQRGRVSVAPKASPWYELAHYGVLGRGVRDVALALDAVADRPPPEPFLAAASRPPGSLRIALTFEPPMPGSGSPDDEVRAAVEGVADTLRSLGHEVVERDPPFQRRLMLRGLSRYFRGIYDDAQETGAPGRLERRTQAMARAGRLVPRRLALASVAEDAEHVRRMAPFFAEFDAVLTAVTTTPPLRVGRFEGRGALATYSGSARFVPFPSVWNMTGQPACSVPAGFSSGGLPLGAQLVARPDDEATLFSLAAQLEAERQWTARRPPSS